LIYYYLFFGFGAAADHVQKYNGWIFQPTSFEVTLLRNERDSE
jgi:hypothetical protein